MILSVYGFYRMLTLFATSPKLPDALQVIDSWGFSYKTSIVFVKDKAGNGYYARQRHEPILIATKSSSNFPLPLPENRPDSVIEVKRGRHSEKPGEIFKIIEKMYPDLPKCELFARKKRKGWKVWGNEIL